MALIALAVVLLPATGSGAKPHRPAQASCFWEGPISMKRPTTKGFDGHYFNFPEESATYWLARFSLPARDQPCQATTWMSWISPHPLPGAGTIANWITEPADEH